MRLKLVIIGLSNNLFNILIKLMIILILITLL